MALVKKKKTVKKVSKSSKLSRISKTNKKIEKGNGNTYILIIVGMLVGGAFLFMGGKMPIAPSATAPTPSGTQVVIISPDLKQSHDNLQLETMKGVTVTPTPVPQTAAGSSSMCQENAYPDLEQSFFYDMTPTEGGTVAADGKIKLWVVDEFASMLNTGQTPDPNNGCSTKTTPGTVTIADDDGYPWEPAIHIDAQNTQSGAKGIDPDFVFGDYNNSGQAFGFGSGGSGFDDTGTSSSSCGTVETSPSGITVQQAKANLDGFGDETYVTEFVWNVSSLKLSPGNHMLEISVHDGDRERVFKCVNVKVQ